MAICISCMSWHAMCLVHALFPISIYFTIIRVAIIIIFVSSHFQIRRDQFTILLYAPLDMSLLNQYLV